MLQCASCMSAEHTQELLSPFTMKFEQIHSGWQKNLTSCGSKAFPQRGVLKPPYERYEPRRYARSSM